MTEEKKECANKLKEEQLEKVSGGSVIHPDEERNSPYINDYTRKINASEASNHIGEVMYFDRYRAYNKTRLYDWILGTLVNIYDESVGCNGVHHKCTVNVIASADDLKRTAAPGSNTDILINEWDKYLK